MKPNHKEGEPTPLFPNAGPDAGKTIDGDTANVDTTLDQIGLPRSARGDFLSALVNAMPLETLSEWAETPVGPRVKRTADVIRIPRRSKRPNK